jgi:hypothetical protein
MSEIPMEEFIIREYRDGDEGEINRLFNEIFGASRSLDEWRWKFSENPTNTVSIALAESGGRIVGQYADVTAFFQYLNKVLLFFIPGDNFVAPRFRGGMKGVQKALVEFRNRWIRTVSLGFPNETAYVVGKRLLKYKDLGKMPVLFMRLNFRLTVRNRMPWVPPCLLSVVRTASNFGFRTWIGARHFRTASAVRTRIAKSFDARIDALWERLRRKHKIVCVRDRRYLDWRYRKPGANYRFVIAEKGDELVGYAVTGVKCDSGATVGHIVDLFGDDSPEVLAALVKRSVVDLLSRKADYALCWMLPDKAEFRTLCQLGFAQNEAAFPSPPIVWQIWDPQFDEKVVGDYRNWFLTMGDSDVY